MKIAVITGASSGIGRSFVHTVDRQTDPDEIWVVARRADRLEELKKECAHPVRPVPLDLSKEESIDEFRALLEAEKPRIGLLVNAAGCGVFGPFAECDTAAQLNSLKLNLIALVSLCRVCLPYMERGDSIVNVGSNSAWQPVPIMAVYGASKSAVLNFSRALWRELRPAGIHVMCVCPGWIRTGFQKEASHDEYIRYVDKWYEPDQVAERAMRDLRKKKVVSILGYPVRRQVRLVKFLPVKLVMNTWCRQQGIK